MCGIHRMIVYKDGTIRFFANRDLVVGHNTNNNKLLLVDVNDKRRLRFFINWIKLF